MGVGGIHPSVLKEQKIIYQLTEIYPLTSLPHYIIHKYIYIYINTTTLRHNLIENLKKNCSG